jgi:uncharacterized coiled-coil protein SlyX
MTDDRPRTPRSGIPHKDYAQRKTSPGYAIPDFVEPEATGNYEGEELARIRARRKTDQRVAHLEKRLDEAVADSKALSETVTDLRIDVREMRAEVRTLIKHVETSITEAHNTERVRISSGAKTVAGIVAAAGTALAAYLAGSAGCA